MITVTKPFLPPLDEFTPFLEKIWDSRVLTNGGPFHEQLELELCKYLGVQHISLCSNGTLGLMIALQALEIKGEVITTPYSFVATSHALLWNEIKPVFVDINPNSLNIDSKKIEAAITSETKAILGMHCYGNPCEVDTIKKIADKYKLKVVYDACHAFGVQDKEGSILRHGDLSVLSFHATKVFNTFEGGAIISPDYKTKKLIDQLKNFGFENELSVVLPGINAKMSEVNAAFGLLQLKYIDTALQARKNLYEIYKELLNGINGIDCIFQTNSFQHNYSYFPILVTPAYSLTRDELFEKFKKNDIFTRRYFYPLISNFATYKNFKSSNKKNLYVANQISEQILCLPLYPNLDVRTINYICRLIKEDN